MVRLIFAFISCLRLKVPKMLAGTYLRRLVSVNMKSEFGPDR